MKTLRKKAVVVFMTAALLLNTFLSAGCNSREVKDREEIQETTQQFIDAFSTGDISEVNQYVRGSISFYTYESDEEAVLMRIAGATEIKEFTEIEVSRRELKAKAKVKIRYIDIVEFCESVAYSNTKDEFFKAIDSYTDKKTANLTLNFVFDEDEGKWLIKEGSADNFVERFDKYYYISVVPAFDSSMEAHIREYMGDLAYGDFNQPEHILDLSYMRIFDECSIDDQAVNDAVKEFAKAYFYYISDHGYTLEPDPENPSHIILSGYVPSKTEILDYYASDERVIEMYMTKIRMASSVNRDIKPENVESAIASEIYLDLAKRIPDMSPEEYKLDIYLISANPETFEISLGTYDQNIIHITEDEVSIAGTVSLEQDFRCRQKAVEALYYAGEISQEKYDAYELALERDWKVLNGEGEIDTTRSVEWEGTSRHTNQAVNVVEEIPGWSDGELIYGYSDRDENGISLFYSKEPGWLNTAGYCIDDDGITVMMKYDHEFAEGTELIFDWYKDGKQIKDSVRVTIGLDGTTEFEFTLKDTEIDKYGTIEFRFWEDDHSHVIAYIELTKS